MIKHLQHQDIDKVKWDKAIDESVNGLIYAKSWYLNIVSPGWEALTDEDYKIVFPLTCRNKYGIDYLYPPFFTQQLGVFFKEALSQVRIEQFLKAVPGKYRFVEINLNHWNKISDSGFKVKELLTHHLNLNQGYEQIAKGYSENLKRNLKKANQSGLQITSQYKNEPLIDLFRKTKGRNIQTLNDSDYKRLINLLDECEKRNLLTKLGIYLNNELTAGALFFKSNHEYVLIFTGANEPARETGAMSFLIDHFIQNHLNENMNLDFEGSMDKNLARFYKSFGATEVVYLQIKRNRLPFYLRWLKK